MCFERADIQPKTLRLENIPAPRRQERYYFNDKLRHMLRLERIFKTTHSLNPLQAAEKLRLFAPLPPGDERKTALIARLLACRLSDQDTSRIRAILPASSIILPLRDILSELPKYVPSIIYNFLTLRGGRYVDPQIETTATHFPVQQVPQNRNQLYKPLRLRSTPSTDTPLLQRTQTIKKTDAPTNNAIAPQLASKPSVKLTNSRKAKPKADQKTLDIPPEHAPTPSRSRSMGTASHDFSLARTDNQLTMNALSHQPAHRPAT